MYGASWDNTHLNQQCIKRYWPDLEFEKYNNVSNRAVSFQFKLKNLTINSLKAEFFFKLIYLFASILKPHFDIKQHKF